jgi:hypothetical protein
MELITFYFCLLTFYFAPRALLPLPSNFGNMFGIPEADIGRSGQDARGLVNK